MVVPPTPAKPWDAHRAAAVVGAVGFLAACGLVLLALILR